MDGELVLGSKISVRFLKEKGSICQKAQGNLQYTLCICFFPFRFKILRFIVDVVRVIMANVRWYVSINSTLL